VDKAAALTHLLIEAEREENRGTARWIISGKMRPCNRSKSQGGQSSKGGVNGMGLLGSEMI